MVILLVKCSYCGFDSPEDAAFCPNCGRPLRRAAEVQGRPEDIGRIIKLGLAGVFLSLIISSVIAVAAEGFDPYFLPTFLSSLIIIYASRTKNLKDAIIISALIYLATDALLSGLLLGTLYVQGIKLSSYYSIHYRDAPTLIDVILYTISPITAILAGFIGYKVAPSEKTFDESSKENYGSMLLYNIKGSLKKLKYAFLGFFIKAR